MGKMKRAARAETPRAENASRTKSTEDKIESNSTGFLASKRGASRRNPENSAGQERRPMHAADDGVLDEWLEPDEDADVDQWLHEHGADSGADDLSR